MRVDSEITKAVMAHVRRIRIDYGWTQGRLALGCMANGRPHMTRGIIAHLENGHRQELILEELISFADAFQMSPGVLLDAALKSVATRQRPDNGPG